MTKPFPTRFPNVCLYTLAMRALCHPAQPLEDVRLAGIEPAAFRSGAERSVR